MATGGGAPCFYNNIDYLKKSGAVVWINSSIDNLYKRLIKEKAQRPLISEVPDEELKLFISNKFSKRKIFYQQADIIINEEEMDLEKLVGRIFHE
jgi:shikimate kinase